MPAPLRSNWYDLPRYYDLSVADETEGELAFVQGAAAKFLEQPTKKPGESVPDIMKRLANWDDEVRAEKNTADILIQKNRHGETGIVRLFCNLSLNRFADLDPRGA